MITKSLAGYYVYNYNLSLVIIIAYWVLAAKKLD